MYEIMTLPNGLRIASEHMSAVRSAAVGIWVGVGSRMEKVHEAGSAHFIEHMLFKGTDTHSAAELAGRMDAIGGQCNAFTTRDSTCFYARCLDTHLNEAADILADMFFNSRFAEEDVINERGVVLEEIDMYRDTPEDLVAEQLLKTVFPGALGRPVLGKPSSLAKMTGESLRDFKARQYTPDRVVLSLCGSFTDAHIAHLAECFSSLPKGKSSRASRCHYTPGQIVRRKNTEQNHFCLGWEGLPTGDDRRFAWQLMSTVFGEGLSSRLFQTVREKYGLCYSIGSFTASYAETGLFGISTALNKDSEEKALHLIMEEVEKLRQDGITQRELDRARELIKSNLVMGMESTSARMNRLGAAILQMGRCLSADEVMERYDAVTREDVLALAGEMLDAGQLSFSALGRTRAQEDYAELFCRH
ncbi:MAG: insulinase family protein [Ruminococcaceae bacterium]|nr:insulinase family protein [Oscillospiraceae bacterium]